MMYIACSRAFFHVGTLTNVKKVKKLSYRYEDGLSFSKTNTGPPANWRFSTDGYVVTMDEPRGDGGLL